MRKLTWLLGAMLLLLSLTGCGNKVDSESIRSYLESSYYNESDASVDEIKDISQEQGNNDKEFIVSCTVKASNRYAVQTANWVITFERFENSWVGTGREMTYYETELQNGMSEEEMKDLVDLEGLYWQKEFESWLTYDVSDWYCTADLENGECEVSYLLTTDYVHPHRKSERGSPHRGRVRQDQEKQEEGKRRSGDLPPRDPRG